MRTAQHLSLIRTLVLGGLLVGGVAVADEQRHRIEYAPAPGAGLRVGLEVLVEGMRSQIREVIRGRSGTPIEGKLLGDGVLATFASAKDAIDGAVEIARSGDGASLPLHVGLHAGDVIREVDPDGRGNVFGGAVNIASRISALAAPGEVLVSQTVRDLARTSAGVTFEDRGEQELKGVSEPVRVFAVVRP